MNTAMIFTIVLSLTASAAFSQTAAQRAEQQQPQAQQTRSSYKAQISIRTDKAIYRAGERPVFRGRLLLGPGNPASGFVRIQVYQKVTGEQGKPEGKAVHDNIVEVKSGEFSDDSFIVQLPREDAIQFSTKQVGYWVDATGIANAGETPLSHTDFTAEEVGVIGTLLIVAVPLLVILYAFASVLPAFMRPVTKENARSMLVTIYVLALIFLFVPLAMPLIISVSSDLEALLRTTPVGFLKVSTGIPDESQWVINIGGVPSSAGTLKGGIGIPLVVLVLSMLGAAINMLRKLPDFLQKYDVIPDGDTAGSGTHVGDELRSELLKHVVYIIGAPFIAMVAFSMMVLADYRNPHAVAIVSFSVGFISDTVVEAILEKARSFLKGKDDSSKKLPAVS